ncbi:hypothetical protein Dimus_034973, partial [Dionaea muscipula]
DEVIEEVVKDLPSPPKKKERKLTKGAATKAVEMVATKKDKEVAVKPEVELPVAPKLVPEVAAPVPAKKTRGKGKRNGNGKSEQGKLPPSLQLPPSVLPEENPE